MRNTFTAMNIKLTNAMIKAIDRKIIIWKSKIFLLDLISFYFYWKIKKMYLFSHTLMLFRNMCIKVHNFNHSSLNEVNSNLNEIYSLFKVHFVYSLRIISSVYMFYWINHFRMINLLSLNFSLNFLTSLKMKSSFFFSFDEINETKDFSRLSIEN